MMVKRESKDDEGGTGNDHHLNDHHYYLNDDHHLDDHHHYNLDDDHPDKINYMIILMRNQMIVMIV